jgi:aspartate aminotransferase
MAPASGFYVNAASGKNQVRIAYVLNVEDLKKAMTCLSKGIEEYNSQRS